MKGPQSEFGWGLIQQQNLPRLYYQAHMPMCASRKKSRQRFCQSSWASLRATRAPGMSFSAAYVCVCVLKGPLYINHHNTLKTEQHALG